MLSHRFGVQHIVYEVAYQDIPYKDKSKNGILQKLQILTAVLRKMHVLDRMLSHEGCLDVHRTKISDSRLHSLEAGVIFFYLCRMFSKQLLSKMKNNTIFNLKFPTKDTISGRSSTIAKSLATSIIKVRKPSTEEIKNWSEFWGISNSSKECVYCGAPATQLDHLNPLIKDKRPTGYITELANLVPCCSKCNGSKGNKLWLEWMEPGDRYDKLKEFVHKYPPTIVPYQKLKGFQEYWAHYDAIVKELQNAENAAQSFINDNEVVIESCIKSEFNKQ